MTWTGGSVNVSGTAIGHLGSGSKARCPGWRSLSGHGLRAGGHRGHWFSARLLKSTLAPTEVVKGKRLHALAHYAAPLPAKLLRRRIDNVAAQGSVLVSAMDAVLSGI